MMSMTLRLKAGIFAPERNRAMSLVQHCALIVVRRLRDNKR
jgi:hypothetical protein